MLAYEDTCHGCGAHIRNCWCGPTPQLHCEFCKQPIRDDQDSCSENGFEHYHTACAAADLAGELS
jgi:hypothetical protein